MPPEKCKQEEDKQWACFLLGLTLELYEAARFYDYLEVPINSYWLTNKKLLDSSSKINEQYPVWKTTTLIEDVKTNQLSGMNYMLFS